MLDPWVREHTGPACYPKAEGRGLWVFIPRMDSLGFIFFLIVFSPAAATGKCHSAGIPFCRCLSHARCLGGGGGAGRVAAVCSVGCELGLARGARTSSDPRASITGSRGCNPVRAARPRDRSAALRCRPGSWAPGCCSRKGQAPEMFVGSW